MQKRKQPKPIDPFTKVVERLVQAPCVAEYRFHPVRRWRFDYAIPSHRIAIEVEGGVWTGGRHTRSKGFLGDMEKYNTATVMGWRIIRTTPNKRYQAALAAKELIDINNPKKNESLC